MTQVLVTFTSEASPPHIEAALTFLRCLTLVARVEFISPAEQAGLGRRATADHVSPDITARGEELFFKGPDGALLAQLSEPAAEVVRLLLKRRKMGLAPIKGSKTLLNELRVAIPGKWGSRSVSAATDAYSEARQRLVGTEWLLIELPRGTYGFRITSEIKDDDAG